MNLHFEANECQVTITRFFPGNDLHGSGSSLKFFIESLNEVGCPQRDPFLLRKFQPKLSDFEKGSDF